MGYYNPYKCRNPETAKNARWAKRHLTRHEQMLWDRMKESGLGFPVSRQIPVCGFIVDFLNYRTKLIIEVDGETHRSISGKERDEWRTGILKSHGFTVIRFWNEDVETDLEGVLKQIEEAYTILCDQRPDYTRRCIGRKKAKASIDR